MRFPPRSVNGNHIHGTARDHTAAMFHFRSGGQIVPQGFSTVQVSRPHDLVGITHYAESYTHRSTASPGPRSSCTSSTQFWMVRSGPHAERSGPSAPVATRVQLPADAERDRSSVGGAHEPSGTGAQSWRSADISCELPVGGPYVPEQIKFQHTDQHPPRIWMNNSGGPIHRCPNCSLYKHDHPPSRFPDKRDAPCPDGGQYAESRGLTQWHPSSSDLAVTPLRGSMQKSRMSPCRSGFLLRALSSGIAAATGVATATVGGHYPNDALRTTFPFGKCAEEVCSKPCDLVVPGQNSSPSDAFLVVPLYRSGGDLACEVGATEERSCAATVAG